MSEERSRVPIGRSLDAPDADTTKKSHVTAACKLATCPSVRDPAAQLTRNALTHFAARGRKASGLPAGSHGQWARFLAGATTPPRR